LSGRISEEVLTGHDIFRKLPFIAAGLTLVLVAASVLSSATPSAADPAQDSYEQEFLSLLNDYRTSNGRVALVLQDDLNEAADWYTTDMATKNYFGNLAYCSKLQPPKPAHCDSLGRMPPDRAKAFGYPSGVGENSAGGFSTALAVFTAWKASTGHNSNMLGSSYRAIGIGRTCNSNSMYGCYWVTDFGFYTGPGSPPGPSTTSTANPTPQPTLAPTPTATPAPTPTPTQIATPTPEPTLATNVWDDINCDGRVSPEDAVDLMRGDLGFDGGGGGCPAVSDLILVEGAWRAWGDTDCRFGVQVLDSIKLLAYLAGVPFGDVHESCPEPGTVF